MVFRKSLLCLAGLCVVALALASDQEVFNLGPLNSDGTATAPVGGTTANFTSAGGYGLGRINISGSATKVISGDFASEARFRLTGPDSTFLDIGGLGGVASSSWTSFSYSVNVYMNSFYGSNPAGNWSLRAFESFNDAGGTDKVHDPLTVTFTDEVNSAPGATDLGFIGGGTTPLLTSVVNFTADGQAFWYRFDLVDMISNGNGTFLDIQTLRDSTASDPDTLIGIWDNSGRLVGFDDDDSHGLLSAMSFGITAPTRALDDTNKGSQSTGVAMNGRDGSIGPGRYYLGIARYKAGYSVQAGWNFLGTGGAHAVGVQARITSNGPVPEPNSILVLGLGAAVLLRRKQK